MCFVWHVFKQVTKTSGSTIGAIGAEGPVTKLSEWWLQQYIEPLMTESLTLMVRMTAPTTKSLASTVEKMSLIIGLLALVAKLASSSPQLLNYKHQWPSHQMERVEAIVCFCKKTFTKNLKVKCFIIFYKKILQVMENILQIWQYFTCKQTLESGKIFYFKINGA